VRSAGVVSLLKGVRDADLGLLEVLRQYRRGAADVRPYVGVLRPEAGLRGVVVYHHVGVELEPFGAVGTLHDSDGVELREAFVGVDFEVYEVGEGDVLSAPLAAAVDHPRLDAEFLRDGLQGVGARYLVGFEAPVYHDTEAVGVLYDLQEPLDAVFHLARLESAEGALRDHLWGVYYLVGALVLYFVVRDGVGRPHYDVLVGVFLLQVPQCRLVVLDEAREHERDGRVGDQVGHLGVGYVALDGVHVLVAQSLDARWVLVEDYYLFALFVEPRRDDVPDAAAPKDGVLGYGLLLWTVVHVCVRSKDGYF
jgi:hypothetical protein